MSKSTPSLLALLGLVAVAGYQNRSTISDMLSDAKKKLPVQYPAQYPDRQADYGAGNVADPNPLGSFMSEVGRLFQGGMTGGSLSGGSLSGGSLSGGLTELVERFKSSGRREPAESWVSDGPNMPINSEELRSVLGEETLRELGHKTGMTPEQVLLRLNAALPDVVNQFTPSGRLPTQSEAQSLI